MMWLWKLLNVSGASPARGSWCEPCAGLRARECVRFNVRGGCDGMCVRVMTIFVGISLELN